MKPKQKQKSTIRRLAPVESVYTDVDAIEEAAAAAAAAAAEVAYHTAVADAAWSAASAASDALMAARVYRSQISEEERVRLEQEEKDEAFAREVSRRDASDAVEASNPDKVHGPRFVPVAYPGELQIRVPPAATSREIEADAPFVRRGAASPNQSESKASGTARGGAGGPSASPASKEAATTQTDDDSGSSNRITPVVTPIVVPSEATVHRVRPLYGEPQQGDLCRMHSLNAYFGGRRFDPSSFHRLCDEFDVWAKAHPVGTSRRDVYHEGGHILLSYAIERYNVFGERCAMSTRHSASRRVAFTPEWAARHGVTAAFMFNDGHIWAWRFHDGRWYEINSMVAGGAPQPRDSLRAWNGSGVSIIVCYPWSAEAPPQLER